MEFKDILAISGMPGLYKYVAPARVSALSDISMFTEGEDIPLAEVFTRMYAHTGGKEGLSHKESPERIKAYFAEIVPDYDRDRVHVSDMKKALSWFNILVGAGFTEFKVADDNAAGQEPGEAKAE